MGMAPLAGNLVFRRSDFVSARYLTNSSSGASVFVDVPSHSAAYLPRGRMAWLLMNRIVLHLRCRSYLYDETGNRVYPTGADRNVQRRHTIIFPYGRIIFSFTVLSPNACLFSEILTKRSDIVIFLTIIIVSLVSIMNYYLFL